MASLDQSQETESFINEIKQLSTNEMALVAVTVENFINIMFDEIKTAGFNNIEFLEKSELFLRSVTPSYIKVNFDIIVSVFKQMNVNFHQTKFYYSLINLRQICNNELSNEELISFTTEISPLNIKNINSNITIFATHLIENIIKYIQVIRKLEGINKLSIVEMRYHINNNFHNCLLDTITQVNMTLNTAKI